MSPVVFEKVVAVGQQAITKKPREVLKATRVASSIVVVVFDPTNGLAGMVHMALPDSRMHQGGGDSMSKYVDVALPQFIEDLVSKNLSKVAAQVRIIGGSQLFNFGGGAGNLLNIGTRNAITARTILNREGIMVEKTETGGNKPRTILFEVSSGLVQVFHPGETPRYI